MGRCGMSAPLFRLNSILLIVVDVVTALRDSYGREVVQTSSAAQTWIAWFFGLHGDDCCFLRGKGIHLVSWASGV